MGKYCLILLLFSWVKLTQCILTVPSFLPLSSFPSIFLSSFHTSFFLSFFLLSILFFPSSLASFLSSLLPLLSFFPSLLLLSFPLLWFPPSFLHPLPSFFPPFLSFFLLPLATGGLIWYKKSDFLFVCLFSDLLCFSMDYGTRSELTVGESFTWCYSSRKCWQSTDTSLKGSPTFRHLLQG